MRDLRTPWFDRHLLHRLGAVLTLGLLACQGSEVGPGGPPAQVEIVDGSGQSGSVGVALEDAIVARVTDADGQAVSGVQVTFAAAAGEGTFTPESVESDERGEARAVWTLGSRSGTLTATVAVEGVTPASVTATASAGAPARLAFGSVPQAAVAGLAFEPPVVVEVQDEFGNQTSSSAEVHLTVNHGSLVGAASVLAVDGAATFADIRIDETGDEYVLAAAADGLVSAESGPFSVATAAVDAAHSTITATPTSVSSGATSVIEVTARDALDNPIPGVVVELSASGAGNTLVQPLATDLDGKASGSFHSTSAGSHTISAEAAGVVFDQHPTISVGPPSVASVEVSPDQSTLLVDQTEPLTASVLDDGGTPIDGAAVSWETDDPGVATVSAAGVVTAQSPGTATITATSGGQSGTAQVTVSFGEGTLTNVTYCTIGGVQDKMDVFIPSASMPRPLPVAVHVHGGGWVTGERSTGTRFTALKETLLSRGYVVVSLDYRLAPAHKYPAQIQDVKCAIRHLRSRASRYGLDPDRIGAWGGSAGGQLVALLGTADAGVGFDDAGGFQGVSSQVQAVIPYSAITDFTHPDELLDDYSRVFETWPDPTSPEMIEASPVTHISSDDPPFFFIVGDDDDLVLPAQSVRMDDRLNDAGVTSSLLRVLHADHDLEPTNAPTDPTAAQIVSRMAEFFDQHLR